MAGNDGQRFTDEEYAFLRYARFGELPPPVRPEERVELTESEHEPRRDRPGNPDEWILRNGAGG